jgi:hypothetical protein
MHREGDEVHETTDEARAGSTPNIVRWILAISTLAAILLLSAIWITGALTTDRQDRTTTVTDRIQAQEERGQSNEVLSDREEFQFGPQDQAGANEGTTTPDVTPTPE